MNRRQMLLCLVATACVPRAATAVAVAPLSRIGAAWRGPKPTDSYFAGVLEADWAAGRLSIAYAVPLPTRPHGIVPEAGGGLLVIGVRPGAWLLRCDGEGHVVRREDLEGTRTRLGGHSVTMGDVLYTTETDIASGQGRVGVRDLRTLTKLDEWDSHGIDPHQVVTDEEGHLFIANGGVFRTIPGDRKHSLERMDSSLVRLGSDGRLSGRWQLADRRLSLRHLAWSRDASGAALLGIALQAEHDDAGDRAAAPLLAILRNDALELPALDNDGIGYTGDIAPAAQGGFAVSSHQAGLVLAWQPDAPARLAPVVQFKESYALTLAPGGGSGGLLVSTAYGLIRWLPTGAPAFLAWPEPMAVDNHWALMG